MNNVDLKYSVELQYFNLTVDKEVLALSKCRLQTIRLKIMYT